MILEEYFDESVMPIFESGWNGDNTGWTHYAVLSSDKKFIGIVSENELLNFSSTDLKGIDEFCIRPNIHPLECIQKFEELDTNVLFCVDKDKFLGAITERSIVDYFHDYSNISSESSIIILESLVRNFSVTEFSKIVESEGIRLSQVQTKILDTENIEVTAVLQTKDLKTIVGVLENKGYHLVQKYNELGIEDHLRERYDNLMNYLNI